MSILNGDPERLNSRGVFGLRVQYFGRTRKVVRGKGAHNCTPGHGGEERGLTH